MKNCIEIPILNNEYKVIVYFGNSKGLKKVLKRYHFPKSKDHKVLAGKRGICILADRCHPVIALPQRPQTFESCGTLAHEAVHAVAFILNYINQTDVGEVFAHSVGAVVRVALEENDKKKKK